MTEPPASTADPVLTLRDVRRTYRGREALKGIALELRPGELLGLFGPNGAGKTTMIRCICGLLSPDSGRIIRHPPADPDPQDDGGVRLGLVPQNLAVYPDVTVQQNLEVFGRLDGVRGKPLKHRIGRVLEWAALKDRTRSLTRTLSGGMQRRLNIACSVLHDPDILLLDEPTVGVDPQSLERIYEMMQELTARGTAVLLTTRQLEEVETRCDRIVVMDHGIIVADGRLSDLVKKTIGQPVRLIPYCRWQVARDFSAGVRTDQRHVSVGRVVLPDPVVAASGWICGDDGLHRCGNGQLCHADGHTLQVPGSAECCIGGADPEHVRGWREHDPSFCHERPDEGDWQMDFQCLGAGWLSESVLVSVTRLQSAEGSHGPSGQRVGFRSPGISSVYVAVFASAAGFPNSEFGSQTTVVAASKDQVRFSLALPRNRPVAIAVFQDIDGNGRLSKNQLGIPVEPYGFSNNIRGFLGPPSFSQAAFTIRDDSVDTEAVEIMLR